MNISGILKGYGQEALLEYVALDDMQYFNAFIQALRYKNKLYLRGKFTEIGKNAQDYYLYLGPPEIDISKVDGINIKLKIKDTYYLVYRSEKHYIKNKCVYVWAIVRPVTVVDDEEEESGGGGAVG